MALLHIQELYSENVRGLAKLVRRKEKWSGLMLRGGPPLHYRGDAGQFRRSERAQNAQDVEIGVCFVKIVARGGAVQNNRLKVIPRRFMQPLDQVFQRLVYISNRNPAYSSKLYQLPEAPPPPLLPPPNPPKPPPPE